MRIWVSTVASLVVWSQLASGQTPTIPQRVAELGKSTTRITEFETGPRPSIDRILTTTEIIVRGFIGSPRSYLSDDQLQVYSDYPIVNPVILYPEGSASVSVPGQVPSLVVTHIGGTVTVLGHQYSSVVSNAPPFPAGVEAVFLLKRKDSKLVLAGRGELYGVFKVENMKLKSMPRTDGSVDPLPDVHVEQLLSEMVGKLKR